MSRSIIVYYADRRSAVKLNHEAIEWCHPIKTRATFSQQSESRRSFHLARGGCPGVFEAIRLVVSELVSMRPPRRVLHRRPSHLTTASVILAQRRPKPGERASEAEQARVTDGSNPACSSAESGARRHAAEAIVIKRPELRLQGHPLRAVI
jgi:hypothetical protein